MIGFATYTIPKSKAILISKPWTFSFTISADLTDKHSRFALRDMRTEETVREWTDIADPGSIVIVVTGGNSFVTIAIPEDETDVAGNAVPNTYQFIFETADDLDVEVEFQRWMEGIVQVKL